MILYLIKKRKNNIERRERMEKKKKGHFMGMIPLIIFLILYSLLSNRKLYQLSKVMVYWLLVK